MIPCSEMQVLPSFLVLRFPKLLTLKLLQPELSARTAATGLAQLRVIGVSMNLVRDTLML